jgi:transposase-like protein
MRPVIRYSEAFKLQVVRDLETGRFQSPFEAGREYGIAGQGTVAYWVRRYGKNHLLRKVVRVETRDEVSEIKQLRRRVRELEAGLADAHLDLKLEKAYTQIACEVAGIKDVEGFKKKHGGAR